MQKNNIFTTSLIYALVLLLLTSCTSCGVREDSNAPQESVPVESEDIQSSDETEDGPETVVIHSGNPDNKVWAEAYLKALPNRNYNGASFIITSPDTSIFDPSEISYLSDAVSKRNHAVEEKFNIKIS